MRFTLPMLVVLVLVPVASAGPVGTVDAACDAAVSPLGAQCMLGCSNFGIPLLYAACVFVDSLPAPGSAWGACEDVVGPRPACHPTTYHCDSSVFYTVHLLCTTVINPTLDAL